METQEQVIAYITELKEGKGSCLLLCINVINLKKNFTNTYHWVSDRGQLIKNEDDILD